MGLLDFRHVPDAGLPARLQDAALNATYASANAASTITRNSAGSVTGITEAGVAETYTRDSAGRVSTVTRAGITKTISRDTAGRVTGVA